MTITTINPANEKELKIYQLLSDEEVNEKLLKADKVQKKWKSTTFKHRSGLLIKTAQLLKERADEYSETITSEMGKTISSAKAEVEKCAWVCEYYASKGAEMLKDQEVLTDASKSYISYHPLGTVLAVMPWNYPFWQVMRFAAPALMAGNSGVLKHASNVPGCGNLIEEVFIDAGFPEGLFQHLIIKSGQVEKVIENPIVKAVTLTGSGPAGSAVASTAAKNIKKAVLELGGNDAYLVLEDADIDLAAEQCTQSRLLNSGQSCIGAKRFIVVEQVYDQFLEKFTEKMASAKMGDPNDENTSLAPMARVDLRNELHDQVMESIDKGATLHLGGSIPERVGAFYPATILTNVKSGMPAYEYELFGPVASVIKVKDANEAIEVANDSVFGLGACVFTQDLKRGERIAKEELEAGSCFVNQFVKSDPRLPFGGIKTSGFGRELSELGIKEFMNAKTVYVA